jgi:hypothetical protein
MMEPQACKFNAEIFFILKKFDRFLDFDLVQGPVNQDTSDTRKYLLREFLTSYFTLKRRKRGGKNWISFFGTHLYLYCPGSNVLLPCKNLINYSWFFANTF